MIPFNEIPDKFKPLLQEGEKVLHFFENPEKKVFQNNWLMPFIILGIVVSFLLLPPEIPIPVLFLFIFWMVLIFATGNNKKMDFIITDQRIIRGSHEKNRTITHFKNIYGFHVENEKLYYSISFPFRQSPQELHAHYSISPKISPYALKNDIVDHWFSKSPYKNINRVFEKWAFKYDLEFIPFTPFGKDPLRIYGKINGKNFEFKLHGLQTMERMSIHFSCLNETKNYLYIRPEGFGDGIGKKLGAEDIQIGDASFDKHFIIRSNNKDFLHTILDDEMTRGIRQALKGYGGTILLGTEEKEFASTQIKKKPKDNLDILDAHLLGEKEIEEERNRIPDFISPFSYKSDYISTFKNISLAVQHVEFILNMMMKLSQKIEDYN